MNEGNATYKYSKYNSVLRLNSEYGLCYNAMSDRFVVLKQQAFEDLCNCSVQQLYESNAPLYQQLLDIKAIVDIDVDETLTLRNRYTPLITMTSVSICMLILLWIVIVM